MKSIIICFIITWLIISVSDGNGAEIHNLSKSSVDIYVNNKQGNILAKGKGVIVDSQGVVSTNCRLIFKWLEDVEHTLTVKIQAKYFPIKKLISCSRKTDIALIAIEKSDISRLAKLAALPSKEDKEGIAFEKHSVNKLGALYLIAGEYKSAVETFKNALSIDTENPALRYHLGIAYFLSGDREAAFEEYIVLKRLDKERADNLFDLIFR